MAEAALKFSELPEAVAKKEKQKIEHGLALSDDEVREVEFAIENLDRLLNRWPDTGKGRSKYTTEWVSPIFVEIEELNNLLNDPMIKYGYQYLKSEWEADAKDNLYYQPERGREVEEFVREAISEAKSWLEYNELNKDIDSLDAVLNWPEKPEVWLSESDYNQLSDAQLIENKKNRLRNNWAGIVLGYAQIMAEYLPRDKKRIEEEIDKLLKEYKKEKYQAKKTDPKDIKQEKLKNKRELIAQVERLVEDVLLKIEDLKRPGKLREAA
ncbi:MAG: hypothetical protein ACOZBH_03625 [Patescibacteria group bacterium]